MCEIMSGYKRCSKCHIVKPLSDFNMSKREKDGHQYYCKECVKINNKQYRVINPNYMPNYYDSHCMDYLAYRREYAKKYFSKLTRKYRQYIYYALKHDYKKSTKCYKFIGLTHDELIEYLEQSFFIRYGVKYDGSQKVEIDHIIPLCSAQSEDDLIKLTHFSNLRLLTAKDNRDKRKEDLKLRVPRR